MAEDWYAEQQEIHEDLLEEGTTFHFRRLGKGSVDPITGEREEVFDQTFSSPGIVKLQAGTPSSAWAKSGASALAGLVEQGDELLLIGAMTYEPALEDRLERVTGEIWLIKGFVPFRPAEVPLLYYLLIRKV